MPNRCAVYGCDNTPNLQEGIALRCIPFWGDERPEAVKRRKRWINFVKLKRAKWEPNKESRICSKHFTNEDFVRLFFVLPGQSNPTIPRLKRDDVGVTVFPTIQTQAIQSQQKPLSNRSRRRVSFKGQFLSLKIMFVFIHLTLVYMIVK